MNPLEHEIERLKNQLEKESVHVGSLDEISEKVLLAVADSGKSRKEIIDGIGLSKAKGERHFDILVDRKFVVESIHIMGSTYFEATPSGRAYLAKKSLI